MKIIKLSLLLLIVSGLWNCTNVMEGCTDPEADNYHEDAIRDDGTCIFSGCMDAKAMNYDEHAETDDNTCIYANCNDSLAVNYDPLNGTSDSFEPCSYNVVLYTKSVLRGPIQVYYQDSLIGVLTSSLLKAPECGDAGTINITLPPGIHHFTTDAVAHEIQADVEKKACTVVELFTQ